MGRDAVLDEALVEVAVLTREPEVLAAWLTGKSAAHAGARAA